MNTLLSWYRTINTLSIDIALGAVFSAMFFAKIFQVQVRPYGLASLGLTVWLIYTADHLRDARSIGNRASSERHFFHQKYFKELFVIMATVLAIDVLLLFFIRKQVLFAGSSLIIVVVAYLVFHRALHFLKELMIALLYTSGVLLPTIAVTSSDACLYNAGLVIQFFLLALINLLMFSWFDAEADERDKLFSFATRFGKARTRVIISALLAATTIINIIQLFNTGADPNLLVLLAMTMVLILIFRLPDLFSTNDYFRLLGDAIFLFPIVAVL